MSVEEAFKVITLIRVSVTFIGLNNGKSISFLKKTSAEVKESICIITPSNDLMIFT